MHKSRFHNSLKLLLRAVLDKINNVRFGCIVIALWHESSFSNRQLQEVIQLLLQARLLYHDVCLVRLCFLDDIKIEYGMTSLDSFNGFFRVVYLMLQQLTHLNVGFSQISHTLALGVPATNLGH